MRYLPLTDGDRADMLGVVGAADIDALFVDAPAGTLLKQPVDLPGHAGEIEVRRQLEALSGRNRAAGAGPFFCGAGAYRHAIPASVDHLIQRSEFLTSYTPYQPEIAQGTLQALYEFQTQVCALTGMDVANASLYDGSSAALEGVLMAARITGRKRAVLSGGLHPHYAQTIQTLGAAAGVTVDALPLEIDNEAGVIAALSDDVACVVVQTPNLFGTATDITAIAEAAHAAGALLICVTPEALALNCSDLATNCCGRLSPSSVTPRATRARTQSRSAYLVTATSVISSGFRSTRAHAASIRARMRRRFSAMIVECSAVVGIAVSQRNRDANSSRSQFCQVRAGMCSFEHVWIHATKVTRSVSEVTHGVSEVTRSVSKDEMDWTPAESSSLTLRVTSRLQSHPPQDSPRLVIVENIDHVQRSPGAVRSPPSINSDILASVPVDGAGESRSTTRARNDSWHFGEGCGTGHWWAWRCWPWGKWHRRM